MKHFRSIDGLRAWLAWTVLFSHVVLHTATDERIHFLQGKIDALGVDCVSVFIIISGFVITHLLLEKHEPYLHYITRRFLRLYPVYIICLSLGIAAMYLHFAAFAGRPWGPYVPQPGLIAAEQASLAGHGLAWHLLAHVTLLHGAVSNRILDVSEYMFLGPAWSLSLEWQFYLLAPLILFGLGSARGKLVVSLLTLAAYCAFRLGKLGDFIDASFLPGAALQFAMGISTRLAWDRLPTLQRYPAAALIVTAGFGVLSHALLPFLFWIAFVAWLRLEQPADAVSRFVDRWASRLFKSGPAHFLGVRSYSTYLIHEPIIHVLVYLCIVKLSLAMWPTVLVTSIVTPLLTLVAAVALYRYVEAPAIAFGKRLFKVPVRAAGLQAAPTQLANDA